MVVKNCAKADLKHFYKWLRDIAKAVRYVSFFKFHFLEEKHLKFKCRKKKWCLVEGCQSFHHPLLHKCSSTVIQLTTNFFTASIYEKRVLLRTLPVHIYGSNKTMDILALWDEASTITLIEKEVLTNLGYRAKKKLSAYNGLTI